MRASLTKRHFILAARMVRAILAGEWTTDFPDWARAYSYETGDVIALETENDRKHVAELRAVWTAEAFMLLFAQDNDRFNPDTFLRACGLKEGK